MSARRATATTGRDVRVGQVWQDADPRSVGRHVRVTEVGTTHAAVVLVDRGTCPVCGRKVAVTKAGRIKRHGAKDGAWPPRDCGGVGQKPKEG